MRNIWFLQNYSLETNTTVFQRLQLALRSTEIRKTLQSLHMKNYEHFVDMIVNEACAVEPSQTDILKDLFSAIGDGDAISEEGKIGLACNKFFHQ